MFGGPSQQTYVGGDDDPTTSLIHLGAREYNPTIGRFLTVDPLLEPSNPQSLVAYTYADNNPTTTSDPNGPCVPDELGRCGSPKKADETNGKIASGDIVLGEGSGPSGGHHHSGTGCGSPDSCQHNKDQKRRQLMHEITHSIDPLQLAYIAWLQGGASPTFQQDLRRFAEQRRNQDPDLWVASWCLRNRDKCGELTGYNQEPWSPSVGYTGCAGVCVTVTLQNWHVQVQGGCCGAGGHASALGATSVDIERQGNQQNVACYSPGIGACVQSGLGKDSDDRWVGESHSAPGLAGRQDVHPRQSRYPRPYLHAPTRGSPMDAMVIIYVRSIGAVACGSGAPRYRMAHVVVHSPLHRVDHARTAALENLDRQDSGGGGTCHSGGICNHRRVQLTSGFHPRADLRSGHVA
jgi:RHS repeat-associated protein